MERPQKYKAFAGKDPFYEENLNKYIDYLEDLVENLQDQLLSEELKKDKKFNDLMDNI